MTHIDSSIVAFNLRRSAESIASKTGQNVEALYARFTKVYDGMVLGMDDGHFSEPFSPPAARQTAHPFS